MEDVETRIKRIETMIGDLEIRLNTLYRLFDKMEDKIYKVKEAL